MNKVYVVTGAFGAIGGAVCSRLSQTGAKVFMCGHRQKETDTVVPGGEALYFDVADDQAAAFAMRQIRKKAGRIDGLVNAAGISVSSLIGLAGQEEIEAMFRVNAIGTINMIQQVSRIMRLQQEPGGSIVNIASAIAMTGSVGQAAYAASKAAVIGYTISAAKELAPAQIRVNAVAPGLIDTPMLCKTPEDKLEKRIASIAMGRMGRAEEVAEAVFFLLSSQASFCSGQILRCDGFQS